MRVASPRSNSSSMKSPSTPMVRRRKLRTIRARLFTLLATPQVLGPSAFNSEQLDSATALFEVAALRPFQWKTLCPPWSQGPQHRGRGDAPCALCQKACKRGGRREPPLDCGPGSPHEPACQYYTAAPERL